MYSVELIEYDIHIKFVNKTVLSKALCILLDTIKIKNKYSDDIYLTYSNGTSYVRVYGIFKFIDRTIDYNNGPFLYTIRPIKSANLDTFGIIKWSDYIRKQIPRRLFNEI